MTTASLSEPGQAVYSPLTLAVYDGFVLGLSCRAVWRCPSERMLEHYERHMGAVHLDVGVGTGYFLDRAHLAQNLSLTLMDLNQSSLQHTARRVARYSPSTLHADVLEPNQLPRGHFDSIGMNFLFHCLPDGGAGKWRALDHLAPTLKPNGVLFGSTILGAEPPLRRQRWLMKLYREKGIFSNAFDSLERLQAELGLRFGKVQVEQQGVVALFSASV